MDKYEAFGFCIAICVFGPVLVFLSTSQPSEQELQETQQKRVLFKEQTRRTEEDFLIKNCGSEVVAQSHNLKNKELRSFLAESCNNNVRTRFLQSEIEEMKAEEKRHRVMTTLFGRSFFW